eukprot:TRINITY_DN5456_c0_g1_i2.p2 TRINITY_DN5456_c0_g1~~TRINITY_DN5456_c0_g1_i2.p2  ORF type:complete len:256 (+),score=45.78 TRINITY_DN5456_c0_g1_i2:60-827(+)
MRIASIVYLAFVCQSCFALFNVPLIHKTATRTSFHTDAPADPIGVTGSLYYLTLNVGTPPQQFTAQLDTGSAFFAIPAAGCSCETHPDAPFDLTQSSTFQYFLYSSSQCNNAAILGNTNACGFYVGYGGGGAIEGPVGIDIVEIAQLGIAATASFGLTLLETGNFVGTDVDGIFGVAYPAAACLYASGNPGLFSSCTQYQSPLDTIVQANNIPYVFSLCLTPSGGLMTIGGYDSALGGTPVYTPVLQVRCAVVVL